MSELSDPPEEPAAVVADTGLFVACGRQQNNKYVALERFAQRNDLTLLIPERVYEELGGAPARSTPGQRQSTAQSTAGGSPLRILRTTPIAQSPR